MHFLLLDYFHPRNYGFAYSATMFTLHDNEGRSYTIMREGPTLSMCRHSNEVNPLTEHVHSLYWPCVDIIRRGNPLTKTELRLT